MVGGYTDATNPWVRGGFYSLAKPANGGKKERENMARKMRRNLCTSFN
jgi:hypothetical protein